MGRKEEAGNPYVSIHQTTGPRIKGAMRSAFGLQVDSRRATSPKVTDFARASTRDDASKVFISAGHLDINKGTTAPLGVYKTPLSLGKQFDASKRSSPEYSFSHLARMQNTPPSRSPDVGIYAVPTAFGGQVSSQKLSQPQCRFGKSSRGQFDKQYVSSAMMGTHRGTYGADPGVYAMPTSIGRQVSSQKHSSPSYSWGHEALHYQMVAENSLPPSSKHERWLSMERDPGTAGSLLASMSRPPSNPPSAFGKQIHSSKSTSVGHTFGSSTKVAFKVSNTPGPGHY